jgi:uncharacterized protein
VVIAHRTPGFRGWQQESWFAHCNDGAAFLGAVGRAELELHGPEAQRAIQTSTGIDADDWDGFFAALEKDGSPTAYLFRCQHCGVFGGYTDAD